MKAFLDTSVLVATFYADHEHHPPSIDLFLRFGKKGACCAAHSLAEVYATLTGMPGKRRVSGDEALLFLGDIRERLTLVALDEQEYFQMVEASAVAGLASSAIYDAILGHCALKAKAEVIYTWNTKDFLRLSPAIAGRVKNPIPNDSFFRMRGGLRSRHHHAQVFLRGVVEGKVIRRAHAPDDGPAFAGEKKAVAVTSPIPLIRTPSGPAGPGWDVSGMMTRRMTFVCVTAGSRIGRLLAQWPCPAQGGFAECSKAPVGRASFPVGRPGARRRTRRQQDVAPPVRPTCRARSAAYNRA